jgi:hypothetical protein
MTTYSLVYIPSEKSGRIVTGGYIPKSLKIDNLEDAEKILAAEFYTLEAQKYKKNIENQNIKKLIQEQHQYEYENLTKQFLEENPREFLRLNYFKVVEK